MKNYGARLEEVGWTKGRDRFEKLIRDTIATLFGQVTDEWVLIRPIKASGPLVREMIAAAGLAGRPGDLESLILGCLVCYRKNRRERGRKKKEKV